MIRIRAYGFFILSALITSFFLSPSLSHASLGGKRDSVSQDAAALSAQVLGMNNGPNYTVYEMQSGATSIREYVNPSGVVFGIAWSGMRHPDLSSLLGTYQGEYQSAAQAQLKQHGKRIGSVTSANTVVETWGHMRKLQGHAILPALLPTGVSAHDVQ